MENNSKKITTFRLNLHLTTSATSVEAAETTPDTAADFMFYGSTPEEFDHALSTILDVVTDTAYGGQLNHLQEIINQAKADLEAQEDTAEDAEEPCQAMTPEAQTPPPAASSARRELEV